jgi:hypothetical protein
MSESHLASDPVLTASPLQASTLGGGGPTGIVRAIYIAAAAEGALVAVPRVMALPGRGLEGDRYFLAVQRYACRKTQGTKDLRQTATLAELP